MLAVNSLEDALKLNPEDFKDVILSEKDILRIFEVCAAAWCHSGDPKDPHAILTSGWCSNGFFNCLKVLKHPVLCQIMASQLAIKLKEELKGQRIDWVIGSPMAGITFSYEVAKCLGAKYSFFVEKDPDHPGEMLWNREQILPGETVLPIEELITTFKTLGAVIDAVNKGNETPVKWINVVGVLVLRPPHLEESQYFGDRKVIALVEREVWAKDPSHCSLCKLGSERVKPKTNWAKLTGKKLVRI